MSKWSITTLDQVATIVSGSTPKTSVGEYWNGEHNWVTPAELNDTRVVIIDTERKITEKAVKDTSLKPLPIGTVLLSSRAPIGKVAIAGVEMYCNQGFKNLICSHKIYNKYLFWFLKGKTEFLNSLGRGATFKEISKTIVGKIEIPLPPLKIQKQIAKTLDTSAELLAIRKQQLAELDNLIKSTYYDMFGDPAMNEKGWDRCSIGKTIKVIEAGWSADGVKRQKGKDEIAVLKVSAVTSGYFRETEYKVLDKDLNIKKYVFPHKNDLLFSRANTRDLVGATCIIFDDYPDLILPDKLWRIEFKGLANFIYMKYILSDDSVRNSLSNVSTGTSGSMYNVSMEKFKSLVVPLPPLALQTQFANIVTKIEEQKALVKQAIDETQHLFDSLMSEYFE
ncbi:restriction endonuclease subunit S [Paenibacillus sp. SAF-054]|uniref:restriction endonuclease subunit S n=1 Tax=unclassified Paenibacillus TaxID=185978 RepID=UPI003F7DAC35